MLTRRAYRKLVRNSGASRHGNAITQRQNGSEEIFRRIELAVELSNDAGTFILLCFRHLPAPQYIISDEQPALPQSGRHEPQHTRIIFLINVVEHYVELRAFFREFYRVTERREPPAEMLASVGDS